MRFQVTAIIGGLVAIALATPLFAAGPAVTPAPEIDGSSLATGLGLLSASILILRARGRSR